MSKGWRKAAIALVAVAAAMALLLVTLLGVGDNSAQAQTSDTPTPQPAPAQDAGGDNDLRSLQQQRGKLSPPAYDNMDSLLNSLVEQVEQGLATPLSAAAQAPISEEDSVAVAFHMEAGQAQALQEFLEENGASPANVVEDYIEAYVPVSLLARVSQQEGVMSVMAMVPPQPAQGRVVSEGVKVHGADVWQQAGVRGEGVKIGIIDLGFEGFQRLMGTDLPAAGRVKGLCYSGQGQFTTDIADCEFDGNHGSTVTETAFDVAPEATYYISNPFSWADLRTATAWMASQGVDVINHSVGWTWSGPGDGTSPISSSPLNTVDYAVSEEILWVNAAGNGATDTWFGPFADPDDNNFHNFDGNDQCNAVLLESGERLVAQLRWTGAWGETSSDDLDLYLIHQETGTVVDVSENFQLRYPYPYERIIYTAEVKGIYCLAVKQFGGVQPDWIQLESFFGQALEHHTLYGSISTPAESDNPGMLAVGATPWYDNTTIEYFSSRGPTPDGRTKPDIVGVDDTNTAADGPVLGTSFAAPHVAGLAALVMQTFGEMGPADIAGYLEDTAQERGEPGPDNIWGHGLALLPASDAPPYDPCFIDIGRIDDGIDGVASKSAEIALEGTLDDTCLSEKPAEQGAGSRYARFYTFELTQDRDVTVSLSSTEFDAYLYLLKGAGKDGDTVAKNDDISNSDKNSRIDEKALTAGVYTIEATTFEATTGGEFSLTLTARVLPPPPKPAPRTDGFVDVSYGSDHACALHEDGSIACWGANEYGKASPPSGEFKSVSSGEHGTCALRSDDGKIVCWGIFEVNR